jgi:hypothetical protein
MELHASWLEAAGVPVPRNPDGSLSVKIEISPLAALDRQEVLEKFRTLPSISSDLHLKR